MKKKLLFINVICCMFLFMTACSSRMDLTKEMNGQTIPIKVGDTVHLELAGNPTTGYSWEIKELDQNVLKLDKEDYSSSSILIGSGGTYTYDFSAAASGETTLKIIYYRSFEPETTPLIEIFEVNIVVE